MTRSGLLRPVLGMVLGVGAVALAARPVAAGDRVDVVLRAAVPAALIAVVGALVLHGMRRRRIATQVLVVALTTLAVVAVGARAAASAMFLSAHDLAVLDLVLVVAALVALVAAFVLATRLSSGVVTLRRLTEQIGNRDDGRTDVDGDDGRANDAARRSTLPAELGAVADALDELDARLRAGDERQRVLESSRRELVAWVSHDIRTPLAGIRALAEALEDGVVTDDETVARYHRTLRVETDRLTRLVDDLFELSRTSAGVLRLRFERVSLDDLVSDAIAASAATARAKDVELVGHVEGSPVFVDVSVSELLRAVRNIVDNGIRHTPPGGTVRVDAGVRDGEVRIAVSDTGGGVAPAERERIFVAGFSGDAARTPNGHGAGLGLAIARGLVEAHAGTIAVDDSLRGARFVVTVPARRSGQDPEPVAAESIAVD